MARTPCPIAPISWGELLDKISILDIKRVRITQPAALGNVEREHAALTAAAGEALAETAVAPLRAELKAVNAALWEIEDAIRAEEAAGTFGPEFIRLARAVYTTNDRRAAIKREINRLLGSALVEEKSYRTGG